MARIVVSVVLVVGFGVLGFTQAKWWVGLLGLAVFGAVAVHAIRHRDDDEPPKVQTNRQMLRVILATPPLAFALGYFGFDEPAGEALATALLITASCSVAIVLVNNQAKHHHNSVEVQRRSREAAN